MSKLKKYFKCGLCKVYVDTFKGHINHFIIMYILKDAYIIGQTSVWMGWVLIM